MGQMIRNPSVSPGLAAVLNVLGFFLLNLCGAGYLLIGQQKKGLISLAIGFVGGILSCGLLYFVWPFVTAYDAYLLAQRLQQGGTIGEGESAVGFLNNIYGSFFKD